jgi:ABC-type glycerol-3-phosphate transport system substrate-binding protein
MRDWMTRSLLAWLAAAAVLALAGCASSGDAAGWITWQEQERERLQRQGFPQYSGQA